jgi:arylsulfatase A-like enzyme
MFVHFDDVDHAGHEIGHGTPQYIAAIEEVDGLIGRILEALAANGTLAATAVLVTADHGGVGRKHGNATMAEIEIPWILAGPGVAKGRTIAGAVNTFDTAPTVARLLGIQAHPAWIGRPVA